MAVVAMPRLSDSMEEGTIVRWLLAEGGTVQAGQELVEIETDKATMTYESELEGPLAILAAAGETVAVGTPIATIGSADGPAVRMPPERAERNGGDAARLSAPAAGATIAAPPRTNRPKASPLARRSAAELGVDLSALVGSGPSGRIVKRDVEAAARPAASAGAPPRPATEALTAKGEVRREEPSRIQETIARRMSEAKAVMPEFTLTTEVAMDAAVALRRELKSYDAETHPSLNDLVIKASAWALRRHPRANAAFRDGSFELYERVNVGFAVAAADALLVPTVFDADRKSLGQIAAETRRLAAAAREGALTPPELAGGTFSVSNLGMYGITEFTAVLNPPQAAILAVGALESRPVVRDGELAIGARMKVTLTCDHRILYGADAAAFLADLRAVLEQPLLIAL